jgi:RHS repeat-associated protein
VGGVFRLTEQNGGFSVFRPDGYLDFVEDTNGNRITASYTSNRLTSLTHSNSDSLSLSYNSQGRISQIVDSTGRVSTYSYDSSGEHLLSVTTPEGTTKYIYEIGKGAALDHSLKSITYTDGTQHTFNYDTQGRLIQESNNGETLNYQYDSSGAIRAINSQGASVQTLLNDFGVTGQVIDVLGRSSQIVPDPQNNRASSVEPDGTTYTYSYDANGNLASQTNPLGQQVNFSYDPTFNQLQSIKDSRNNPLSYSYDTKGNLTTVTYADNTKEEFSYDSIGNVSRYTNRRNQTIDYTYNKDGLVSSKAFNDGTTIAFGYDTHGNLTSTNDASGTTTFSYDNANQIARVTYPNGRFLAYSYDSAGRRSRLQNQDGFASNYFYDKNGRLERLTDVNDALVVRYEYDAVGRLEKEAKGNGTYSTYEYDNAGQLTHLVHYGSNGSTNSRFDYAYNVQSLVSSMTTLEGTTTYEYDAIGQLTSVSLPTGRSIQYRYDAAGNRITVADATTATSYATNNLNQYTQVGNGTYAYDADGNLISKTENGQTWIYSYNTENRLTRVETLGNTWEYEYNAFGARTATNYNGQRTEYLVDPTGLGDVIGEYSGSTDANYAYGIGLESQTQGINTAYFDFDALGSTSGLTGLTGNYLNSYNYLPFGESLNKSETIQNSFEYVGQWGVADEANGLKFMRARFYDSLVGRFTQRDPIGINGGLNLYAYTQNSPSNAIDPSGLVCWPEVFRGIQNLSLGVAGISSSIGIGSLAPWLVPFAAYGTVSSVYQAHVGGAQLVVGLFGRKTGLTGNAGADLGKAIDAYQTSTGIPNSNEWKELGSIADAVLGLPVLSNGIGNTARDTIRKKLGDYGAYLSGNLDFDFGDDEGIDCEPLIPPKKPGPNAKIKIVRSSDPNDIVGPAGFGQEKWITSSALLPYTIRFENRATATAPAQQVSITQQLDLDLDWRTFRLSDFGWGELIFDVPDNTAFYNQRIDLTEKLGFYVDVIAGIDITKGEAFWTLTTIDPATGEIPINPLIGFLPPDNPTTANPDGGLGDGFVNYTIKTKRDTSTGAVIDAKATIIFDTEEPIDTPAIFNTIDDSKPTSTVNALPTTATSEEFLVSWSGSDSTNGSALANFTIYISDNGAPFTPWLENTKLREATYIGQPGHTYDFYSIARDNAGNIEATPTTPDAQTRVSGTAPQVGTLAFSATEFQVNEDGTPVTAVTVTRTNGSSGTASATVTLANNTATAPSDYNSTPIAVNFADSETTKTVIIPIENDLLFEGNETVTLTLSNPTQGAAIGTQSTATLTIVNDDALAILNPLTDANTAEDTIFNFTIPNNTFNPDPNLNLNYTATLSNGDPLPSWLNFNPVTRTFNGTPTNSNVGNLTIKVTVANNTGTATSDTFDLTITNTNDAPIAQNDDLTANEDTPVNISIATLLSNDSDIDGDILTLDSYTQPTHGQLENDNNGNLTYTPEANYNGSDSFSYTINDSISGSNSATVNIAINSINDTATISGTTTTSVTEDANTQFLTTTGNLTVNDPDLGENQFTPAVASEPNNLGTLVVTPTGIFTYSVDNRLVEYLGAGQTKTETFTVKSLDGTASQDITIIINGTNDTPITDLDKTLTLPEDAAPTPLNIAAPTDIDGDSLTILINTLPDSTKGEIRLSNGTVVTAGQTLNLAELTSLLFAPVANANGSAGSFSYTVNDGQGGSATQAITLNITPDNGGGSSGDPHIITFDQLHYDFQATGDFILARALDSDLEVQVRQAPWELNPSTTVNIALATIIDGNRVEFYIDQPYPIVNGILLTLQPGETQTLGQGNITRTTISGYGMQGDLYTLTYPNGDALSNQVFRGFLMDPSLDLAGSKTVIGLLGNNNGNPEDDLALKNGSVLSNVLDSSILYGDFAESWRVSDDQSLFSPAASLAALSLGQSDVPEVAAILERFVFGGDGNDTLIGVQNRLVNPGNGEVDLLMGNKGADTFVLGDKDNLFYVGLGQQDYALITDLWAEDTIQLHGNANDYVLGAAPVNLTKGTGIFLASDPNELIGIIQGLEPQELSLSQSSFQYI